MNPKSLIYMLLICLASTTLLVSCGGDDDSIVDGEDNEVIVLAVTSEPDTANIINDPVWDNVDEASIRIGIDSIYTDYFGPGIVRVKAIQDGESVYMRFTWSDSTRTAAPGMWYFERVAGSAFTQEVDTVRNRDGNFAYNIAEQRQQQWENEDVISIFFDFGNGSIGANCALSCHLSDPDTSLITHQTTGNGNVDAWVWRAGRTDPFGVAEDYFWTDNSGFDQGSKPLYSRNAKTGNDLTDPRVMHILGSDFQGTYLYASDTTAWQLIVTPSWEPFDSIPGYIYYADFLSGSHNRYDVRAKSEYDPQLSRWTVVLWRSMLAPNQQEDVAFEVGQSYEATLAVMKNTLQRHSGSRPFTFKF